MEYSKLQPLSEEERKLMKKIVNNPTMVKPYPTPFEYRLMLTIACLEEVI
jgi:hypothetical protein